MKFNVLQAYSSVFHSPKSYHLISGGRASGKSTQVAIYFIMKLFEKDYFRGVISRYTIQSIKHSIYQDIMDLIKKLNLSAFLTIQGDTITHKVSGNMILCHSIKIADGNMTAKSKGLSNVTHLLIDEATEIPTQEEYIKLVDSFRYRGAERKIFLCFNPTYENHWIFKRFFLPSGEPNPKWSEDHNFIHTTYLDNIDNIDPRKVLEWEQMKNLDPHYYDHHILGKWRRVGEGQVFKDWEFGVWEPDPEASRIIGLDFGFFPDPTAIVEVRKKDGNIWIKELFYGQNLTNQDICSVLSEVGITRQDLILADTAEPKSIEEIRRCGFNIRGATKGKDSIRHGIQLIHQHKVFCFHASNNIIKEYYNYVYRTGTNQPVDTDNHAMDAIRYALSMEKPRYSIYRKNVDETDVFS